MVVPVLSMDIPTKAGALLKTMGVSHEISLPDRQSNEPRSDTEEAPLGPIGPGGAFILRKPISRSGRC